MLNGKIKLSPAKMWSHHKNFLHRMSCALKMEEKNNNQKKEQKNAAAIFFLQIVIRTSTSFALVYCAENKLYHVFLFQLVICSAPLSFGRKRKIVFFCMDDGTKRDFCIIDLMQKTWSMSIGVLVFFNNKLTTTKIIRKIWSIF